MATRVPPNPAVSAVMPTIEAAERDPLPAPDDVDTGRYFPFLPGEDTTQSISVGDTSDGYLVGSAELKESDAVGILPEQKKRDLRYGTRELIEMIERAGEALYRETKTRLWVGNVGKREGGDISWSVSHNSGRDADIAFCYTNTKGVPQDPPDLVPLNSEGFAKNHDLVLDAKRTWIVIKALLSYPNAQVQYLFMADRLKTAVITHASQIGEPAALITHAAAIIRQPHGSASHNDHLHLRIFCSERDVLGGCTNTGGEHPWTKTFVRERERFVEKTAELLDAATPEGRKRAIERLSLLDARQAADKIADMLTRESNAADVREAAARSLARLGGPAQVPLLMKHYRRERAPGVRIAITQSIGDIGGRDAGRFLARAIGRPQQAATDVILGMTTSVDLGGPTFLSVLPQAANLSRDTVLSTLLGITPEPSQQEADELEGQLVAIDAAARSERLEPMKRLIALLGDPRPQVRDRAARALRMITNLSYSVPWKDGDAAVLSRGRQRWQQAHARSKHAPRNAWLVLGFAAANYQIPELNQSRTWELVRAIAGPDHISYNAQRVLMRLLKHDPPSLSWSKGVACMHWYKWIRGRRQSFKLEKPPEKVFRACAGTR